MPAVQLIPAVCQHQRDPGGAQHPGQERHQIPGRCISPVQVLQHHHGGLRLPQPDQEAHHAVEHRTRIRRAALARKDHASVKTRPGQLRESLRAQVISQLAQQFGERRERDRPLTQRNANTDGRDHALLPGLRTRTGDKPALADPGVPVDQHHPSPARCRRSSRCAQNGYLFLPAYEPGRADSRHTTSIGLSLSAVIHG